jgi:hypothetical protein
VVSPNPLPTDGFSKGCFEGSCHFWHLVILGFSRNTRPYILQRRDRPEEVLPGRAPVELQNDPGMYTD